MPTLLQIQRQIDRLQVQAHTLRAKEASAVIERVKLAIQHYDLTPADLFSEKRSKGLGKGSSAIAERASPKKQPKKRSSVPVKYRDSDGNTWTGRGSQPRWLAAQLKSGRKIDEFAVKTL